MSRKPKYLYVKRLQNSLFKIGVTDSKISPHSLEDDDEIFYYGYVKYGNTTKRMIKRQFKKQKDTRDGAGVDTYWLILKDIAWIADFCDARLPT